MYIYTYTYIYIPTKKMKTRHGQDVQFLETKPWPIEFGCPWPSAKKHITRSSITVIVHI